MAGHSKWANIKHKKAAVDAKRGKVFTKLIREIVVAAKKGGGDLETNPWLRLAVDKSRGQNMKKDTIDNAIARGAGLDENDDMAEIRYEGYGPGGVAVMVDCLTDNRNRTVAEIRHAFTKSGGNLGTDGSVSYLFTKTGVIIFPPGLDEDALMEAAIEAGADDVVIHDDQSIEVLTDPNDVMTVKDALFSAGFEAASATLEQIASTELPIDSESTQEKLDRLINTLEECDDVQEVHTNAN